MTRRSRKISNSAADTIGQTPLVDLPHITANLEGRNLARLEYLNPGFSKKDRAALRLLSGSLPGATIAIIACDSGLKYLGTDLWN